MSLLKELAAYRFSRYFKLCFLMWDIVLLNVAIILSFLSRYHSLDRLDLQEVRTISLLSNLFWVLLLLHKDSFRIIRIERIETILMRAIRMILIHVALIVGFIVLLKYSEISRLRLLYFYLLFHGCFL
jgi:putative colanic acid biosynthesis UDP-glucose lipid carrier transferase